MTKALHAEGQARALILRRLATAVAVCKAVAIA